MYRTLSILSLVLFAAACGDDSAPPMNDGGGPVVGIAITATDILSNNPIADMNVCVTRPNGFGCQMSDAAGLATLMAPANSDVLIRYTKDIYFPSLNMVTTTTADADVEADLATMTAVALTISQTPDMMSIAAKGHVIVLWSESGPMIDLSGITVTVAPGTHSVLYFNESMVPDATRTETSDVAIAAVANLDPGEYSVTYAHPALNCGAVESGWTTADPKMLRFPIEADTVTILQLLDCE